MRTKARRIAHENPLDRHRRLFAAYAGQRKPNRKPRSGSFGNFTRAEAIVRELNVPNCPELFCRPARRQFRQLADLRESTHRAGCRHRELYLRSWILRA